MMLYLVLCSFSMPIGKYFSKLKQHYSLCCLYSKWLAYASAQLLGEERGTFGRVCVAPEFIFGVSMRVVAHRPLAVTPTKATNLYNSNAYAELHNCYVPRERSPL